MFTLRSRGRRSACGLVLALSLAAWSLCALSGCGDKADDDGGGSGKGGVGSAAAGDLLKFVPADAVAAIVARPKQLLSKQEMESFPVEIASAAGIEHLGIDPLHVETVLVVGDVIALTLGLTDGPPSAAILVRADQPIQVTQVFEKLRLDLQPAESEHGTFYKGQDRWQPCAWAPDEKTLAIGSEDMLRKMQNADGSGPLASHLAALDAAADVAVVLDVAAARQQEWFDKMRREAPGELQGLMSAVEKINVWELTLTCGESLHFATVFHAQDAAGGEFIAAEINKGLVMARGAYNALLTGGEMVEDPDYAAALRQYMDRVTNLVLSALEPVQDGERVTVAFDVPFDFTLLGGAAMLWSLRASHEMQAKGALMIEMERMEAEAQQFNAPPGAFQIKPSQEPGQGPPSSPAESASEPRGEARP